MDNLFNNLHFTFSQCLSMIYTSNMHFFGHWITLGCSTNHDVHYICQAVPITSSSPVGDETNAAEIKDLTLAPMPICDKGYSLGIFNATALALGGTMASRPPKCLQLIDPNPFGWEVGRGDFFFINLINLNVNLFFQTMFISPLSYLVFFTCKWDQHIRFLGIVGAYS